MEIESASSSRLIQLLGLLSLEMKLNHEGAWHTVDNITDFVCEFRFPKKNEKNVLNAVANFSFVSSEVLSTIRSLSERKGTSKLLDEAYERIELNLGEK